MGKWIDLGNGRKRFVVEEKARPKTFAKFYGGIDMAPIRGSALDGTPDFLMKTAPDRMRRAVLKKHGKQALKRTFMK